MLRRLLPALALLLPTVTVAADPVPPKGFTAAFNGKDLTGWHGWAIHAKGGSPADLAKLSEEDRKKAATDKTAAELDPEQKNLISHRGKALRRLLAKLKEGV